jgi:hypothetical protein
MESQQFCSEDGCDRDVFTLKSGLCQRHYDRARTARKAAERGDAPLVRDTPCNECGAPGYHSHVVDNQRGALCRTHWDMHRRRGTTEPAHRQARSAEGCSDTGCSAPVHARGLCQAHYRASLRRAEDPARGTRKPGPKPAPGAVPHQRISEEEKALRLASRREAKTKCVNGHPLSGDNLYISPRGTRMCVECRNEAQRRYQADPVRQAARTSCKRGHEFTEENTRTLRTGVRQCRICVKAASMYRLYGLTLDQVTDMLVAQDNKCAICRSELLGGKETHVDHDHGSGAVRSLLCRDCNLMLGNAHDSPERLEAAALYLRGRS